MELLAKYKNGIFCYNVFFPNQLDLECFFRNYSGALFKTELALVPAMAGLPSSAALSSHLPSAPASPKWHHLPCFS